MAQVINESINVNAFYFTSGKEFKAFPRQMEYTGGAVTFTSGLRCLVQRGGHRSCFFTMSDEDGIDYRIRQEGNQWTLVSRA